MAIFLLLRICLLHAACAHIAIVDIAIVVGRLPVLVTAAKRHCGSR